MNCLQCVVVKQMCTTVFQSKAQRYRVKNHWTGLHHWALGLERSGPISYVSGLQEEGNWSHQEKQPRVFLSFLKP